MAKINHILFGQGKGKVGGLVLQRYEGMNVAREKPISVKNPQSTKQIEQRAKFKLATQVTANFKEVISAKLANLSIYERSRRAASVNAIIGVVSTATPDSPQVLVQSVVAAINAKSLSSLAAPTITYSNDYWSVIAASGDTVVYVHCVYNTDGGLQNRTVETYTSDGTAKQIAYQGLDNEVIMVVAFHALTESGTASLSNLSVDNSAFLNNISRSVAAGDIEISPIAGDVQSKS